MIGNPTLNGCVRKAKVAKKWRRFPESETGARHVAAAYCRLVEVEQLEQIADRRAVHGDVGILVRRDGVRDIVAAADVTGFSSQFRSMNFRMETWSE